MLIVIPNYISKFCQHICQQHCFYIAPFPKSIHPPYKTKHRQLHFKLGSISMIYFPSLQSYMCIAFVSYELYVHELFPYIVKFKIYTHFLNWITIPKINPQTLQTNMSTLFFYIDYMFTICSPPCKTTHNKFPNSMNSISRIYSSPIAKLIEECVRSWISFSTIYSSTLQS